MSLERFIKILTRKYLVILCSGILTASMVYLLTRNEKKQYSSKTVVNTGVVSGYNIENHNSDSRVDRDYTRNELENLINLATAYETLELLSLRLIAQYVLLDQPDPEWISSEGFSEITTVFNGALSQDNLRKGTLAETIIHLEYLKDTIK